MQKRKEKSLKAIVIKVALETFRPNIPEGSYPTNYTP